MRTFGPANRRVKICVSVPELFGSEFCVIQLSVNGQVRQLEPGANVERLLDALELAGKRVAVEKNGEIVPRSRYADTRLADGDKLEIVVAVGGG